MALALTSRRRTAAAAVSAIAAAALAAAVVGRGCRVSDTGPEATVRRMIAATNAGDRNAVHALLSTETQERLADRAERATELVGANIRYTALDLIAIGSTEDIPQPTDVELVRQDGDRAVVEIVSTAGRGQLALVREQGRWRIDLPGYASPSSHGEHEQGNEHLDRR